MQSKIIYTFLAFTGIFLASCEKQPAEVREEVPKLVKVFLVGSSERQRDQVFTGKVEASQESILSFQVPGEVIEKAVEKGQSVEKGQLLVRLNPQEFTLEINETKAIRDQREVALGRTAALLKKGFSTPAKYDKQKADLDVAQAQYEKALKDMEDSQIYAPFDGSVADVFIDEYQQVKAKEPIVAVHNLNEIDIVLDVPEQFVIRMEDDRPNPRMEVRFDAAPEKTYVAKYRKHTDTADPKTQTFRVYLTLPSPTDLNIRPGMTASVTASGLGIGGQGVSGFFIPVSAVVADEEGQSYVWVVDPETQKVERRNVRIGLPREGEILVKEGLVGDEKVVSAGANLLQPGQIVSPTESVFGR